jgi:hypothetical protein
MKKIVLGLLLNASIANAADLKQSSHANQVFSYRTDKSGVGQAIRVGRTMPGEAAATIASFYIPDKTLLVMNCTQYMYQGVLSGSLVFSIVSRRAIVHKGDDNDYLLDGFASLNDFESRLGQALFSCPLEAKEVSSLQIFVPINPGIFNLVGLFSDLSVQASTQPNMYVKLSLK